MLKRECTLFVNRFSGGYSDGAVSSIEDSLKSGNLSIRLVAPDTALEMEHEARSACRQSDSPLLVVIGGDGTVNTVLNGIEGNRATLGYIPLGTANVLAHELGIDSVQSAISRIIKGESRECSTGLIRTKDSARRFLLMAGVGFDGQVVHGVTPALKRSLGKGAYVVSALREFAGWDRRKLQIVSGIETVYCHSVIFCNASRYGGNMLLAPDASLFNPGLNALCIQSCNRFSFTVASLRFLLGRTGSAPGCRQISGSSFAVHGEKCVQLDGDTAGFSPLTVSSEPGTLRIIT